MTANNDSSVGGHVTGIVATRRTDSWWISPAIVVDFIGVCFSYGTWTAFQRNHYWVGSMGEHVGIYRTEDGLGAGLAKPEGWRQKIKSAKAHASSQYNSGWHEALDLESMAILSQTRWIASR